MMKKRNILYWAMGVILMPLLGSCAFDELHGIAGEDNVLSFGVEVNAGQLVLSPTRTYAPVIKKLLDLMRPQIHGMVHCTGGAQTKVLHFVGDKCRVVKDNMFPIPPLFRVIHDESGTEWKEMYKVFNMGHRMEIYVSPEDAEKVIETSRSFNIDAQIVGHIEDGKKSLTIKSEYGTFDYE